MHPVIASKVLTRRAMAVCSTAAAMSPAQSLHRRASDRRTTPTRVTAQTCLRDALRVVSSRTGRGCAARSRLLCACPPRRPCPSGAPRTRHAKPPQSLTCIPGSVAPSFHAPAFACARAAARRPGALLGLPGQGRLPQRAWRAARTSSAPASAVWRAESAQTGASHAQAAGEVRHAHGHPRFAVAAVHRQDRTALEPPQQQQVTHVQARAHGCTCHRSGSRLRRARVLAQGRVRAPLDEGWQGGPSSSDLHQRKPALRQAAPAPARCAASDRCVKPPRRTQARPRSA
jgi:hypothetical protein